MKYNIKKLYENEERDDDDFCHRLGSFKLNTMDRILTNCPNKSKKLKKKNK